MFLPAYVKWRRPHECSYWRAPQDILLVGASVEEGHLSSSRDTKVRSCSPIRPIFFEARITGFFVPVVSFQALTVTMSGGYDGSN